MDPIQVTAAIIERDGAVLIARRPPGGRHPGSWEFPGGKVEPGESPRECLAREMEEEMGIAVVVAEELARVRHSYPDLAIDLLAFRCEIVEGEPADIGCDAHAWVEPDFLADCDLLPPDRELVRILL
ncbi:MAG: (deoxy)nucleoside triphosphate pyrophosphohydrolase [Actinobacteria bacterium]|nr:(deoxy)nucleoside triphosphate pyrophosphohydrolase [Actinomycetota bacterium]MCG2817396.1 (deoxy)nucleoside triphosphate pyrophosphohydrolase [Actinomycetes bacterium]MBU4179761.1 (deoxy)nucleoside triphosphate pyrophosphohydrolase [Actinomycetota bacterium]MBU4217809.1 (deoxy)nucleoside triphosphate pyrophosphohydrolase [Actinomycetota bacterium]MBU4359515.1 (deoxy)nucleoside triphosphate pyrophosphohydrolase [Actinomycetota bacterium]